MAAFTPPGSNPYPHPPPPQQPSSHHNNNIINGTGGAGGDGIPLHAHHGLPPVPHQYAFTEQPQHQHPHPHPHQHPSQQQQQQHPIQLQYTNSPSSTNGHPNGRIHDAEQSVPPPAQSTPGGAEQKEKGNRLRKACDSCSIRKVKCDETGPPCKACASLDIPCTFDRPSRRRGPPNRHAEAIKKRKLDSENGFSSPTSPSNVAATLASFSSHAVLNAESICPFNTLELLVDDYFTYIHPLVPFPHEPSFRVAFKNREDLNNPKFLSLLAAMIGSLVASFPRNPRLHLKAQHREHLFPNSISLVERCHKVAVEARGAGYLDKQLNVYDAATSYLLGLSHAYTFKWKSCRLYFGETLTILRVVGAYKVKNPDSLSVGALPAAYGADPEATYEERPEPIDFIKQEIGRRIFWIMFLAVRSMQQLGASFGELLIPPPTPREPFPPYPMEVDDEYIYLERIDPQPAGIISKLTGFNLACEVYMTVTPLATMEMAYGIDEIFDFNRQKRVLEECLRACRRVLDKAPPELLLIQPDSSAKDLRIPERDYYPPVQDYPGMRTNGNGLPWLQDSSEPRRKLQYEIQKANIYASQLGTRSYIVEKYWNLQESYERVKSKTGGASALSSPGVMASGLDGMLPKQNATSSAEGTETNIAQERESIVKDLLQVLGAISQVNMEPNGGSFINKIRQIASTLIDTPQDRKGPLALKSEEYLGRFLDVLMKLERVSPGIKAENGEPDEEEELRNWADLREYQMQFMQAGGFMNEIG